MPRRPVPFLRDQVYHLVARGNDGQEVFACDSDRLYFVELLGKESSRLDVRVMAFALMPNHVHAVVRQGDVSLSCFLHATKLRYSKYANHRYGRSGHLFESPSFRRLVADDADLLSLVRYVHLNPVRAGFCAAPEEYRWASHRAYLGSGEWDWLNRTLVLGLFPEATAPRAFDEFVRSGIGTEPEDKPRPRGSRAPLRSNDRVNYGDRDGRGPERFRPLLTRVCNRLGVAQERVLGRDGSPAIRFARVQFCREARTELRATLGEIGEVLGYTEGWVWKTLRSPESRNSSSNLVPEEAA